MLITFTSPIASSVVGEGRGCGDVCSIGQECEGLREKLGGSIRVEDIWRSEGKNDAIQEGLEPGACLTVEQRDDHHVAAGGINQGQSLGLSGESRALALEVHTPAGSRCMDGEGREKSVSSVLTGFVQLTLRAVLEPLPNVPFHCPPKVGSAKEGKDFGRREMKHPLVSAPH